MKYWQKILVSLGFVFVIFTVLRVLFQTTGFLAYYSSPTPANAPGIEKGSVFCTSILKKPKKLDFVTYKGINIFNKNETKKIILVHRLIATEGDKVELKNHRAFVNGIAIDKELNLKMAYLINTSTKLSLMKQFLISEEYFYQISPTDYIAYIDDNIIHKNNLQFTSYKNESNDFLAEEFQKPDWTIDNLGPFIVPKGKVFLLGDNRQNSMDSRFTGCIPVEDITGVKL